MGEEQRNHLTIFNEFRKMNVTGHSDDKNGLKYLSWSKAWEIFKEKCPDATYEIVKNEKGLPYFESDLGIMVYTRVTVEGLTHEMWLTVMDGANRALKITPQTYKKFNKKTQKEEEVIIPAATMCDINKTVMRCLTKNLAMFGVGLHLYEGEDIPMLEKEEMAREEFNNYIMQLCGYVRGTDNPDALQYYWDKNEGARKDETFLLAMNDQLRKIIKNTKSIGDINNIYVKSVWAQTNPDFLDWCEERKVTLEQDAVA